MSEKVVWQMLKTYVVATGLPDIAPHDLRRTTAKLCRAASWELEPLWVVAVMHGRRNPRVMAAILRGRE
jgi:hypothetical protein